MVNNIYKNMYIYNKKKTTNIATISKTAEQHSKNRLAQQPVISVQYSVPSTTSVTNNKSQMFVNEFTKYRFRFYKQNLFIIKIKHFKCKPFKVLNAKKVLIFDLRRTFLTTTSYNPIIPLARWQMH